MASIKKIKGSDGTGPASLATVQSTRSSGSSTIHVDTVAGIPPSFMGSMGAPHTFTDPVTSETITVIDEATAVDFSGHVDGSNLEIDAIAPGFTDTRGSVVGDIVVIRPTTQWADNVAETMAVAHNDDGTPNDAGIHYAMPAGAVIPYAGASAPTGFLMCDGSSLLRASYAALFAAIGTAFGAADGTHFNVPDMRGRTAVGVGSNTWSFSFASSDVNTGTDQIAVTANSELITGRTVVLTTTGTLPTGLALATTYYIIVVDSTHIKLATSLANAVAGTAIDITGAGSGTHTATHTGTARTLAEHGGEQTHANTVNEMASHTHAFNTVYNNSDGATGGTQNTMRLNAVGSTSFTINATGGSSAHNNMQPYLGLNHIIKT